MSKFDAIRDLLRDQTGIVDVSMDELSDVVIGELPKSAYTWGMWLEQR